jgi:hypothetical protein
MNTKKPQELIVESLKTKASTKQAVYDNTKKALSLLKTVISEYQRETNNLLKGYDKRIMLEYRDRGKFEAELKIAGDLLIFSMHSNIFEFEHNHSIWKSPYILKNKLNSFCGIINIYNFLNDSFRYNRLNDLGYLIARIFINRENHYFVEGKRQLGFLYNNFDENILDKSALRNILESAILYTLEFDLYVPPYDTKAIVTVEQMTEKFVNANIQTAKRLGFQFHNDNDNISENS